jgi:hypothetical protein
MKLCRCCNTKRDMSSFYPHPSHTDGLSTQCRECIKAKNKAHYHVKLKGNPLYKRRVKEYAQQWYQKNITRERARISQNHKREREQCFERYGRVCACCGEDRYEFLSLDHIAGNGAQHRREMKITKMARWLIKNGFPEGFRVLCHNCNMALGQYGYCPHDVARKKAS